MLHGKIKLDSDIYDGIVLDISMVGAQIAIVLNKYDNEKLFKGLQAHTDFKLLVQLPGESNPTVITVHRQNVRSLNAKLSIGVGFSNLRNDDAYRLKQFIYYAQSLNLHPEIQ